MPSRRPTSRRARSRWPRATFALNDLDVELLDGPWLAPVGGRRFDLIVSNPPFVPGPARVDYVYRDSGQAGDDALAALVRALPAHLEPGGVAQLLGSWLHVRGEDWPDRVRSWLPGGVDAWIVQREVTDPALHVGTWQRDAGLDLHSPAARAQAGAWLDWLAAQKVEAVGFGFLTLRRTDPGARRRDGRSRTCPTSSPTRSAPRSRAGSTASTGCARTRRTTPCSAPGCGSPTAWCSSAAPEAGRRAAGSRRAPWSPGAEGPRWRHEVDEPAAALLAGCRGALPLRELVELLAFAHDRPVDALVAAALPAVREMVRHGLLVPADAGVTAGGMRAVVARVTGPRCTSRARPSARSAPACSCCSASTATTPTRPPPVMARKLHELRILDGERSCAETGAPLLVVSQFTLYGDTRKGRRPSWSAAAPPDRARPLVDAVVAALRARGATVATGVFGAAMAVESVNDGPFTVLVEG